MTGFKYKRISKVCLLLFVHMYKLPNPQLTLVFSACTTRSTRINFVYVIHLLFFFFILLAGQDTAYLLWLEAWLFTYQ